MDQEKKETSPQETGRLLQGIGILLIGVAALIYAIKSFPKTAEDKYYDQMFESMVSDQTQQLLKDAEQARKAACQAEKEVNVAPRISEQMEQSDNTAPAADEPRAVDGAK